MTMPGGTDDPENESMIGDLGRWYAASTRAPAERSRHLSRIEAALAESEHVVPQTGHGRVTNATGAASRSLVWRAAALLLLLGGGAFAVRAVRDDRAIAARPVAPGEAAQAMQLLPGARDIAFTLRLSDATARQVNVAGDFNGWDASTLPMERDPADGIWRLRIALSPGRHTYSYVVDGTRWVIDPLAPRTIDGALGPANVIAVPGES